MNKNRIIRKLASITAVVFIVAFGAAGCAATPPKMSVHIEETIWDGWTGSSSTEEMSFSDVSEGDELYSGFSCSLKVEKVSGSFVYFSSDGLSLESDSGGISLLPEDQVGDFKLKAGESITLATQTMDAGATLVITVTK